MPKYESNPPQDAVRPGVGDERLVVSSGSHTIASEKHPERNEDSVLVDEPHGVYAVFDGMGGHAAGDMASRWAMEYVTHQAGQRFLEVNTSEELASRMSGLLVGAHDYIKSEVGKRPGIQGAGSTGLVARTLETADGRTLLVIANVGDSRASMLRGGILYPLTLDDSFSKNSYRTEAEAWEAQGVLDSYDGLPGDLSRLPTDVHRAGFHQRNVITQALGSSAVTPRTYVYELLPGDRVVLSTDGVGDNLTTREAQVVLNQNLNARELSRKLCEAALDKSHKPSVRAKSDDISAVVIDVRRGGTGAKVRNLSLQEAVGGNVGERRVSTASPERGKTSSFSRARTVEQLWEAIGATEGLQGSKEHYDRGDLYDTAGEILNGRRAIRYATSTGGFRQAVETVGCREYTANMINGGHETVFSGARLGLDEDVGLVEEETVLMGMIDSVGYLVGSSGERYTAEQLKNDARSILQGRAPINAATRTQGFRDAIQVMLSKKIERSRR